MPTSRPPDPKSYFPFELDPFQRDAMGCIAADRNVLVCAPTGSGKTAIAEYAVHVALAQGRRVFYTTPLKALSNQKFRDLGALLGEERVGLLTGDISIQRDADIVVMTTEVFRNMLYGTSLGAVETNLRNVHAVILDEVHFMNDAERGTVWEESIIYCPPSVRLIALSATVANASSLAAWMSRVHGETVLIASNHRPVPLRFHLYEGRQLTSLRRPGHPGEHRHHIDAQTRRRLRPWEIRPDPADVVATLRERDMLPAIYFVFSRKGCEEALADCGRVSLLSEGEMDQVGAFIERHVAEYPSAAGHPHLPYLVHGAAAHHAGLLPALKVLVERLFQQGLLKVVFATETLAAGINMPARSTVLTSITKRGDRGHRSLTASEFLQMSGRAGRRGMDEEGHVVVIPGPNATRSDAQDLAAAPPDPLGSHFTPTYGMVLNLLQRHTLEECRFLISRSFGEFLEEERRARSQRRRTCWDGSRELPAVNWTRFMRLKEVLEQYGYVEGDHPTPRGVTAAALRADHELLVAECLLQGLFDALTPAEAAAVAAALVAEELRRTEWTRAFPSKAAARAVRDAARIARQIRTVQQAHRLDLRTAVHSECCGLTQLWAEEAPWDEVMAHTSLDEGDVVRVLRRTMDLLEQFRHAPMLDSATHALAEAAARALNREPVREVL